MLSETIQPSLHSIGVGSTSCSSPFTIQPERPWSRSTGFRLMVLYSIQRRINGHFLGRGQPTQKDKSSFTINKIIKEIEKGKRMRKKLHSEGSLPLSQLLFRLNFFPLQGCWNGPKPHLLRFVTVLLLVGNSVSGELTDTFWDGGQPTQKDKSSFTINKIIKEIEKGKTEEEEVAFRKAFFPFPSYCSVLTSFRCKAAGVGINHIYFALSRSSSSILYTAVVKGKVALPCDISPPSADDGVALILWYKDEAPSPIYTLGCSSRDLGAGQAVSSLNVGPPCLPT
ncbi:ig-like domain-containing protein [Caerostris extrusa]|uniref:Ig-like domain-containing protein n=1 Tax=Caerostris extrusa TaxID=172846 RepID=A0AAV4TP18_CAEEX|nr:ig-like domain-containing protein [Caerostris extrusa]